MNASPTCRNCGSTEFCEIPVHQGRSVRRDCARCGRTFNFPVWNGEQNETSAAKAATSTAGEELAINHRKENRQ